MYGAISFMFRKYTLKTADELSVGPRNYKGSQEKDRESSLAVQGDLN